MLYLALPFSTKFYLVNRSFLCSSFYYRFLPFSFLLHHVLTFVTMLHLVHPCYSLFYLHLPFPFFLYLLLTGSTLSYLVLSSPTLFFIVCLILTCFDIAFPCSIFFYLVYLVLPCSTLFLLLYHALSCLT